MILYMVYRSEVNEADIHESCRGSNPGTDNVYILYNIIFCKKNSTNKILNDILNYINTALPL